MLLSLLPCMAGWDLAWAEILWTGAGRTGKQMICSGLGGCAHANCLAVVPPLITLMVNPCRMMKDFICGECSRCLGTVPIGLNWGC